MKQAPFIDIDFETRSLLDIKNVPAYTYAEHPSTEIYMVAINWDEGRNKTAYWDELMPVHKLMRMVDKIKALVKQGYKIRAHNVDFEYNVWNITGVRQFKFPKFKKETKWACTAARSRAQNLGRSLGQIPEALGLEISKDDSSHMLFFSRPLKGVLRSPKEHRDRFKQAGKYNVNDVDVQVQIVHNTNPLTKIQEDIFYLTERINHRGIRMDIPLAKAALEIHTAEVLELNKKAAKLAKGAFEKLSQREKVRQWCCDNGYQMDNLQSKSIRRILAEGTAPKRVMEMLRYRDSAAKISISKYKAAIQKTSLDGRIHEILLYHGAKTGRWTGLGLQFHNLVRPKLPKWTDYDYLAQLIKARDIEGIECLYGDITEALSSSVRSMIIPADGNIIHCADYAAIEARIVLWLAGELGALEIFRSGGDIYKDMASTIYDKLVKDITDGERFVGKQAILGLGYQMGYLKFVMQVYDQSDILFENDFAKKVVTAYRSKYSKVVDLWKAFDKAAVDALLNLGPTSVGPVDFFKDGRNLNMRLPSGRVIVYPDAKVRRNQYDKPAVHYKTWVNRKWVTDSMYGGKWVENATQGIAADIMGHGMLNADANGYPVILSVHDESASETKENFGSHKEYEELLCDIPPWAGDCPIAAEGWSGYRYRK